MIDFPFGRLDNEHGEKLLKYLPSMSNQVILLATDREIRDEDIQHLGGKIQSDYTLEWISKNQGSTISPTGRMS